MSVFAKDISGWRFRFAGAAPWLVAMFIIAGLVHILSVLAMPRLAERDAYARFAEIAPVNQLRLISPDEAARLLPYEDPAMAMAVCRFDLSQGPLRLRGNLAGGGLLLLSFRDRLGRAFFAMTDRGTSRGRLDVIIATRAQLDAIEAQDEEDETPAELRLPARGATGFILLRALARESGAMEEVRQRLGALSCASEKPAQQ